MRAKRVVTISWVIALSCSSGCGGSSQSAPPRSAGSTDPGLDRAMAPGTSGLPGLDWGAQSDAIMARYPGAKPGKDGVAFTGLVEGHPATIRFTVRGGGLSHV